MEGGRPRCCLANSRCSNSMRLSVVTTSLPLACLSARCSKRGVGFRWAGLRVGSLGIDRYSGVGGCELMLLQTGKLAAHSRAGRQQVPSARRDQAYKQLLGKDLIGRGLLVGVVAAASMRSWISLAGASSCSTGAPQR